MSVPGAAWRLALGSVLAVAQAVAAQLPPGTPIAQAELARLGGGTATLLGSGTTSVIVFFRPGQEHSRDALAMMAQCEKKFAGRPVHWAAVVSDRADPAAVTADVQASGIAMPVLIDKGDLQYAALKVILHPVVIITDKQNRVAAYLPYQRIDYCHVVEAHLAHVLGELDDAGLQAVLHPPPATQGGDASIALRQLHMGQKHLEAQRFDLAAVAANKAIEHDATLVAAHVLLGQALAAQGDCTRARAAFERALALDKTNTAAQDGLKGCPQ